jgi:pyruvate ferredoxin oxidoreductase alpha subunit
VGLIKIRCYRPFPHEDIYEAIKDARIAAVLDANISLGNEGALGMDLKAKLFGMPNPPLVLDFIAGLGGREINIETICRLVDRLEEFLKLKAPPSGEIWLDLNHGILP